MQAMPAIRRGPASLRQADGRAVAAAGDREHAGRRVGRQRVVGPARGRVWHRRHERTDYLALTASRLVAEMALVRRHYCILSMVAKSQRLERVHLLVILAWTSRLMHAIVKRQ